MARLDDLRGASPHAVALAAGLPLSVPQAALLKAIGGDVLTRGELSAFRTMTGTGGIGGLLSRGRPRPGGYDEIWDCSGRRAGKDTRIGACCALSAAFAPVEPHLAPGEFAFVLLVGPTLQHTRTLFDSCTGLADALGLEHDRVEGELRFPGLRTRIKWAVADELGARGVTAVAVIVTEPALLPTDPESDGYDVETIAALRPTLATTLGVVPHSRLVAIGTPWDRKSVFQKTVEAHHGKTGGNVLAVTGPTWFWNPAVTEARTHALEADPVRWAREYAASPSEAENAFLARSHVLPSVDTGTIERPPNPAIVYGATADFGPRSDQSALCIFHVELVDEPGGVPGNVLVVDVSRTWSPASTTDHAAFAQSTLMQWASILRRYRVSTLRTDLYSIDVIAAVLRQHGIRVAELPMDLRAQERRWNMLATRFRTSRIRLVDSPTLVRELLDLRQRLRSAGLISVGAPNRKGAHDDQADCLALAAELAEQLTPSGGDIVCSTSNHWDGRQLHVKREWFRPLPDGGRMPVHCPVGTPEFFALVERSRHEGWSTPTIAKYLAEHEPGDQQQQQPARTINVRVTG